MWRSLIFSFVIGFFAIFGVRACSSESGVLGMPRVPPEPPNTRPARDHASPYLPATAADADRPLDLTSSPAVDERRFLAHRLVWIGLRVPDLSSSDVSDVLDQLAMETHQITTYIISKDQDPEIRSSYEAVISMLDGFQEALTGRSTAQASQERLERDGQVNAFAASAAVGLQAQSWEMALLGGAMASLSHLQEQERQVQAITDAQQAKNRAAERLAQRRIADIDVWMSQLADRHQWRPGSFSRWTLASMTVEQDSHALLQRFLRETDQRQDDPFVALEALNVLLRTAWSAVPGHVFGSEDRRFALEMIDFCLGRLPCIPPGRIFDQDRITVLLSCALMLGEVDSTAYVTSSYQDGPTSSGRLLRRVLATYRSLETQEPEWMIILRAHSLAASGDLTAAATAMSTHLQMSDVAPAQGVYYAGILAAKGDLDNGMTWLEKSIKAGYNDFKDLATDRDLYLLHKAYPARWKTATTPVWAWDIVWGIFQDDITITNRSPFPLTNVTLRPAIVVGGSTVSPTLAVIPELAPGGSYTWSNCMSLDKDKVTSKIATLVCDQVVP